ncbi:MAG: glucosamine-6-phosphate deaminase [Bacillota bacterium]|nr:glucosamine-6-phosphate deaminase [Bacillota bacterium]
MRVVVCPSPEDLGVAVARHAARILRKAIAEHGSASLVLSTGRSQFETLEALVQEDIDWSAVECYHLDEYVDLPPDHPASFRRYLHERLLSYVSPRAFHFVTGDEENRIALSQQIRERRLDLGLIGIGENAHIAFNDPPADFETTEPFINVELDEACRQQQFSEGWFESFDLVPRRAVTMTVHQIMQCRTILQAVPFSAKADAVAAVLGGEISPWRPASVLRRHPDVHLYVDTDSFAKVDPKTLRLEE